MVFQNCVLKEQTPFGRSSSLSVKNHDCNDVTLQDGLSVVFPWCWNIFQPQSTVQRFPNVKRTHLVTLARRLCAGISHPVSAAFFPKKKPRYTPRNPLPKTHTHTRRSSPARLVGRFQGCEKAFTFYELSSRKLPCSLGRPKRGDKKEENNNINQNP